MTQPLGTVWSDERLARATQLWKEGKSATEVAAALNGEAKLAGEAIFLTRNAIISKMYRSGQEARIKSAPRKPRPRPPRIATSRIGARCMPTPLRPEPLLPEPTAPSQPHERKLLADLGPYGAECRWPHGDAPPFEFCAAPTWQEGAPYCEHHTCIAGGGRPTPRRATVYDRPPSYKPKHGGIHGS